MKRIDKKLLVSIFSRKLTGYQISAKTSEMPTKSIKENPSMSVSKIVPDDMSDSSISNYHHIFPYVASSSAKKAKVKNNMIKFFKASNAGKDT